jgi:hypothetical protein
MSETKRGHLIITELKKPLQKYNWSATYRPQDKTNLLYLDDDVLKGAFLVEAVWFWPAMMENANLPKTQPHKHDYDEILALIGTNPDDPHDLCGEVEMYLDGEKHVINKSCITFIPAGMEHGPIRMARIDRPIFHFCCGTTKKQG